MRATLLPLLGGLVAMLILSGPAAAQDASKARASCEQHLAPAYAKSEPGRIFDCGCIAGYLVGRFGPADGEVVVRLFAAAALESRQQLEAIRAKEGDAFSRILSKAPKFQDLGREMDQTCPSRKS